MVRYRTDRPTSTTPHSLTLDVLLLRGRVVVVLEDDMVPSLRFDGGTSSIGNVVGTGCLSRARQTRCRA